MRLGLGGGLLLLVLSLVFRVNFFSLFSGAPTTYNTLPAVTEADRGNETREVQFVSFVLDDVQSTWERVLPTAGRNYRHATLVLFRDYTASGCGTAQTATGPFYCPPDEKVYIDLAFFDELRSRFGAPGEFAQAYVLAHEVGHHVQKILGVGRRPSVGVELQADCFAGVWAHTTAQRKMVDRSDVEAGLRAAAAVGDDRIQHMTNRAT
jgi:predicted metalloprotease